MRKNFPNLACRPETMECEKKIIMLRNIIESFEDFPKPGIIFRDIFSILRDPVSFKLLIGILKEKIQSHSPDVDIILGIEARGFLFGSVLAYDLGKPFIPIRKKGKLPGEVESQTYKLEYGEDCFEIQKVGIEPGKVVVIVDDLLATGGTMKAAGELVTRLGGEVSLCLVCVELLYLKGRKKLNYKVDTVLTF